MFLHLKRLPELLVVALLALGLILVYCYILDQNGIIPIGGKKAPSYVIVLFFQWFLVQKGVKHRGNQSIHFLHLFVYQYAFVIIVGILSFSFFHWFFQSSAGLDLLNEYIRLNLLELSQYQKVIVQQEGQNYYLELKNSISQINAFSIAKDDFFQKIALSFLPNLLISLYYKRS
ncbi:hypothetical protein [Aquirufa aurantiipilula]|uniref:DUF4199 domain-containing protein n=1 Tax=Aquirufa aurantiipilula TaxID=2696561 RepID=A0ABT6BHC8_9BACT|nr:hypothetical protein [Aquirufa aurantiipilula]MBZ1325339.1 hypothetical protein [Aquirufa aurantiipilula]MDF5689871.1 hypothetical protein [Aquirufa aurantiipilula]